MLGSFPPEPWSLAQPSLLGRGGAGDLIQSKTLPCPKRPFPQPSKTAEICLRKVTHLVAQNHVILFGYFVRVWLARRGDDLRIPVQERLCLINHVALEVVVIELHSEQPSLATYLPGIRHTKFAASSVLPCPVYCEARGYGHSGRVRSTLPLV